MDNNYNEFVVNNVLNTMSCIRELIDRSKTRIREYLDISQLEEAAKENSKLNAMEKILNMLEEDFNEQED